jgi:hypothetical protein
MMQINPQNNHYNSKSYAGTKDFCTSTKDLSNYLKGRIITQINVTWADCLVGLEIFFHGDSSGELKGSTNKKTFDETFKISGGDYITEIFGRQSTHINCLGFKFSSGLIKTWGNPIEGEPFDFKVNGFYVQTFNFGVGEYLNFIEPIFMDTRFLFSKQIPYNVNTKTTESLGNVISKAKDFDDINWIKDKVNYSVNEIKIFHNGKFCHGIHTIYNMNGTTNSPGANYCKVMGIKADSLVLMENEYVTSCIIRAGNIIDQIGLYTNKGRNLICGGEGGIAYGFVAPPEMQIVAFRGKLANELGAFEIYCDKIY